MIFTTTKNFLNVSSEQIQKSKVVHAAVDLKIPNLFCKHAQNQK